MNFYAKQRSFHRCDPGIAWRWAQNKFLGERECVFEDLMQNLLAIGKTIGPEDS